MILKASFEISGLNSHVYNILKDVRLLNRKKKQRTIRDNKRLDIMKSYLEITIRPC